MGEQSTVAQNKKWGNVFYPFWISQLLSILGSMLVQFTLAWWLTEKTGSASILATATLVGLLPELIIKPFAGAVVDRMDRKLVIIISDLFIALVTLILIVQFWLERVEIWQIFLVMALRGIASAFHFPAEQASVAMMVPKNKLTTIAGYNQIANGTLNLVSAPMGALVLEFMDIQGALFIDIVTAFIAILILFFISIPRQSNFSPNGKNWIKNVFIDFRKGFKYLIQWKALVTLIIILFVFKIALVPAFSLIPLFIYQELEGSAVQFSMTEVAVGIGLILGGVALSTWGSSKKRIYTILIGGFGIGAGFLGIGILPKNGFVWMMPIMFFGGFMISLIDGSIASLMQAKIDHNFQGRVWTLFTTINNTSGLIGLALVGLLSNLVGLRFWFLAAGGLIIAAFLIGMTNSIFMNIDKGPTPKYS